MNLEYVPLLQIQRNLQAIPRHETVNGKPKRFLEYLRTILNDDGQSVALPPLVAINPMAKDHVTAFLDALLALDADGIAHRAAAEALPSLSDVPGDFKATVVVVDDQMGAWTNRCPCEFDHRFRAGPPPERLPRWTEHFWVMGYLWSSEPVSERAIREAMLTAVFRLAYTHRHGPARTLRDMLAQEGRVLAMAGCAGPALDPDDVEYTREVIAPYLDAEDKRLAMECLFGDDACRSMGFTPHGLSPWAGLALALHDAKQRVHARDVP